MSERAVQKVPDIENLWILRACPQLRRFKKSCFLVTPKKVELTFKLPFCMPSKQAYGSQICLRKTDKFLQIIQMI